jgi:DNA-binding LytR/AlgR family response regulator
MKDKLNCIVVDDDVMSLKIVEALIKKTDFLHMEGLYESPLKASEALQKLTVDLIFLDVEMPDMNGLELISTLERPLQIILISYNRNYALDAFQYDVTDYLLKPISYDRFLKASHKALANVQKQQPQENDEVHNIFVKVDSLLVNFDVNDIYWLEAFGDYVKIRTSKEVHTVYTTMKALLEKLPYQEFVRIHRSYIVRIDKIKNIGTTNLQILNRIFPIGNSYKKELMDRIVML